MLSLRYMCCKQHDLPLYYGLCICQGLMVLVKVHSMQLCYKGLSDLWVFPEMPTETDINCCWKDINPVKNTPGSAWDQPVVCIIFFGGNECCQLAHSKVQEHVLCGILNLGATGLKALWRTTVKALPSVDTEELGPLQVSETPHGLLIRGNMSVIDP